MANEIKIGDIATHTDVDSNTNRFNILKWTSITCTSQETGEHVCDIVYYEKAYKKEIFI